MTDDDSGRFNLSRRKALAGLGSIGVAGAIGGLGTTALFNDEENVNTTVTAGKLDLKLDWLSSYNGQIVGADDSDFGALSGNVSGSVQTTPTQTDGEMILVLNDVKPGDCGCTVLSVHVDENPAFLWMQAQHSSAENGLTEPEAEAESSIEPQYGMYDGAGDGGELADALEVNVFYDDSYDCKFNPVIDGGGDTHTITAEEASEEEDEDFYTAFRTLTGSGIASDSGILLDGVRGTGALTRASAEPKWLSPFFPTPSQAAAEMVAAGSPANSSNVFTDASTQSITDDGIIYAGEPGNFAVSPLDGSAQSTGTQYIAFEWCIPKDVGNEIQGDSLSVNLRFHAQQARHNAVPISPFDGESKPDFPIDLAPQVDPADYYLDPWDRGGT